MTMLKTGVDKAIFLWAIISLIGFAIWQFWQPTDFFGVIHWVWIPLTIIGVLAMYKWVPNPFKNNVVTAWAIIVIVGMLISIAMWQRLINLNSLGINYGVLWAGLMVIGFAFTAWKWVPQSRPAYAVATVLCFLVLIAMVAQIKPVAELQWAFVPLGLAIALPMIYDSAIRK